MIAPFRLPTGKTVWLDLEVQSFVDRLKAYDDRLALIKDNPTGRWEIWRVGEDGKEHFILRSKPGAKLDAAKVIGMLQAGDTRAPGNDPIGRMIANNERVENEMEKKVEEATLEAMDKVLSKAWRGRIPTNVEDVSI